MGNKKILLGSQSPRRKELLEKTGLPFKIVRIPFDEKTFQTDNPVEMARQKSLAYSGKIQADEILLTADTMVFLQNQALGKPAHAKQAVEMLKKLAGKTHEVQTGVCLRDARQMQCFIEKTLIRFSGLTDEEIKFYVSHYKPLDKAGAYGIQEWIGLIGIEYIQGDFYNVMGLPVHRIWQALKQM